MRKTTEKGITLIALVITIIILLILAGISIQAITNTGLFENAKEAKKQSEIANIKEQIQLDIYSKQVESIGEITENDLKSILEKYGTIIYEEDGKTLKGVKTEEGYEILLSEVYGGEIAQDKGPTFTTVANAPDISGFNKSNTYYVSWDLTSSPYEINDSTLISGTAPSNWYDYTAGVNHWANVKTTGGGNDCYWVWIPRYAYKVPEKSSTAQTIEIKFLDKTTNIPIGETEEITNTTPTPGEWVVHPAFTNAGNGGFGELTGIWVAKYEASSSNVSAINLENGILTGDTDSLNGNGGGADTTLKVRVKPNVTSWRGITVNGIFTVCRNLTTSGNSLEDTTNIDSHMMKNTEWGAVAYLSSSKYGKTDTSGNRVRVYNNPYYNNITNYSPITGLAGATATATSVVATNLYVYNTQEGVEASTTGNVYGVYDMVGGAWEYVAAIYKGGTSNDNRSELWEEANSKYVDQYTETTGSQSTYYGNIDKYGDAVYETSSSGRS